MNTIELEPMDGKEIAPGVFIVGEPAPVAGTDKLRALADVGGALCVVELKIRFEATKQGGTQWSPKPNG